MSHWYHLAIPTQACKIDVSLFVQGAPRSDFGGGGGGFGGGGGRGGGGRGGY